MLLCCRGTFSAEDAFVDLLATGVPALLTFVLAVLAVLFRFFGWHGAMPQCWTLPSDCTRLCLCTVLAYNAVCSCALPAGTDFDDISDSCADGECRDVDAEPAAAGRQPRLTGYCHSGMGRAALFLGRKFGTLLREVCVGAGWRITTAGHSLGAGELRIERWMHSLADVVFDFVGWSRVKVPHQPASSHVGQCILPLSPGRRGFPADCVPAQPRPAGGAAAVLGVRDPGVHGPGPGTCLLRWGRLAAAVL